MPGFMVESEARGQPHKNETLYLFTNTICGWNIVINVQNFLRDSYNITTEQAMRSFSVRRTQYSHKI